MTYAELAATWDSWAAAITSAAISPARADTLRQCASELRALICTSEASERERLAARLSGWALRYQGVGYDEGHDQDRLDSIAGHIAALLPPARTEHTAHICTESNLCRCYMLADEPNWKCPVHGYPWPPRCDCGRFVKRSAQTATPSTLGD